MWWSGEVRSNRFADHTSLYVRCPRGFLRFASRLDEDATFRFCFSMAGGKDRSCRPIGNLPSARSFRHRWWQTASSISAARTLFSTRWSEEVRARHGESSTGRALLGTDAPITSRAFRNQHSRALGKGLIRIVGSLAAATSRRLCFRTDSWSCHRHRELFLLCWVQGRGRTCRTR